MSELPSRNDCLPRVNSYNHSASTCLSDVILLIPPRTYTSLTGDHSIRRCKSKKKIFSHTSFLDDNVLLSIISPPNEPVLVPSPTVLHFSLQACIFQVSYHQQITPFTFYLTTSYRRKYLLQIPHFPSKS